MLRLLTFGSLLLVNVWTQSIRCYQCLAPRNAIQLSDYCVDTNFCTGTYCFKGPDTTSTGIVHDCVNTPPIDQKVGICKVYNSSSVKHNCYCKNQDFCNLSSSLSWPLLSMFLLYI